MFEKDGKSHLAAVDAAGMLPPNSSQYRSSNGLKFTSVRNAHKSTDVLYVFTDYMTRCAIIYLVE